MESGYLLRDVVNLVDDIHFNSSEEIHTLSRLYEGLLREMRDAAGDSGEFYTPRAVVRLMVQLTDPKLGEVAIGPACGTGGFLAEAFSHLERQANTVEKRRMLQAQSIRGGGAKSLPYLLAQMNLLLHGLEAPDIDPGNALRFRLSEMGDRERVDVILTNPPFGGEEETGILTSTGTNVRRKSLHPSNFEGHRVLLPSLEEQRRIVARLDAAAEKSTQTRSILVVRPQSSFTLAELFQTNHASGASQATN